MTENSSDGDFTYRALPSSRDFNTRHAAAGHAAILDRRLDRVDPVVTPMTEEMRETMERVGEKLRGPSGSPPLHTGEM